MEEKVLKVLSEKFPDIDFTASEELVDDGTLDSLMITGIVAVLSEEFGISVPFEEIVQENFNSIKSLTAMVERLK